MRTILLAAVVLFLLALDWAALHDILRGEPDLRLEYAMLLLSLIVFAAMLFSALRRKRQTVNPTSHNA